MPNFPPDFPFISLSFICIIWSLWVCWLDVTVKRLLWPIVWVSWWQLDPNVGLDFCIFQALHVPWLDLTVKRFLWVSSTVWCPLPRLTIVIIITITLAAMTAMTSGYDMNNNDADGYKLVFSCWASVVANVPHGEAVDRQFCPVLKRALWCNSFAFCHLVKSNICCSYQRWPILECGLG